MSNRRKIKNGMKLHKVGEESVIGTNLPDVGAINAYRCDACEKYTVVIHVDKGVTPMFLACRTTPDCKGRGVSLGYPNQNNVPDNIRKAVAWEWYRPVSGEKVLKDPMMRDHIERGGLALRERR